MPNQPPGTNPSSFKNRRVPQDRGLFSVSSCSFIHVSERILRQYFIIGFLTLLKPFKDDLRVSEGAQ